MANSESIEREYKLAGLLNNQLKYVDVSSLDDALRKLINAMNILGIIHDDVTKVEYEDEYYDTADEFLLKNHISLRHRLDKTNMKHVITLKTPVIATEKTTALSRKEYEEEVAPLSIAKKLNEWLETICGIQGVALQSNIAIINQRHYIKMHTKVDVYTLCFDKYYFYSKQNNAYSDNHYGIEIEAEGATITDSDSQLLQFISLLETIFDYSPENISKYKKAIEWKKKPVVLVNRVFMMFDLVQYSLKSPLAQREAISHFFYRLRGLLRQYGLFSETMRITTGDGLILAFEENVNIFPFISSVYSRIQRDNEEEGDPDMWIRFRVAIHYGSVFEYQDINGNLNYAGDGINTVTRILNDADEWQLVSSEEFFQRFSALYGASEHFSSPYFIEVKHGRIIQIRNYFNRKQRIGVKLN